MNLDSYDWSHIGASLDDCGHAVLPRLMAPGQCSDLRALYARDDAFRSRIVMARHGFGAGEYKYFAYPLPTLLNDLRGSLYRRLAPIANRWNGALKDAVDYPLELQDFTRRCHAAGQTRPTPLMLKYGPGDYNNLHRDLYGEHVFPLQATVLLSRPGLDFTGGEFVMTESGTPPPRVDIVPLEQGDAVIFAVHRRPCAGLRGTRRVAMRHGVSRIHEGERYTLGVIFHDAA
ncbi:MAG TPA: 2OG-Fe(II) oxygenase [Burkholderiaceae bacterium]|nr:2OG-Fe(II) oxygenase [Burkholderiaceae bacterium]